MNHELCWWRDLMDRISPLLYFHEVLLTPRLRHTLDPSTGQVKGSAVAKFPSVSVNVKSGVTASINSTAKISNPLLWGPAPAQTPNLYRALTTVSSQNTIIDTYETTFGIRSVTYDANQGILVNGEQVRVQGTNNHHDQGSLGAAFHVRAAERQLQTLQEMGGNALRMSHNPPAPELLELADQMGFMVLDEIFDCWNIAKSPNDFALIFADWHEPDLRSFIRRDRNHPSVIAWSFGNEVGEQTTANGSAVAQPLHDIVNFEDPTRPATASMNVAAPNSAFANVMDIKSLNYQGEGVRTNPPTFPLYHAAYPNSMLWSSESAATLSSRSIYIFPVVGNNSATESSGFGANDTIMEVSDYDLYAASFGMSPDLVFERHDMFPFAAGEFVWSGFDYLGEPTVTHQFLSFKSY
jgi:beta-galactosidase